MAVHICARRQRSLFGITCMLRSFGDLCRPSPRVCCCGSGSAAAIRAATPPPARTSCGLASPAVPRSGDRVGIELRAAFDDLGASKGSRRSKRRGSQKWEPTCSAALGLSATQSESSRGSGLPVRLSPTVTDTSNRPGLPWHGRGHWSGSSQRTPVRSSCAEADAAHMLSVSSRPL